jgi:hypothetical protein
VLGGIICLLVEEENEVGAESDLLPGLAGGAAVGSACVLACLRHRGSNVTLDLLLFRAVE